MRKKSSSRGPLRGILGACLVVAGMASTGSGAEARIAVVDLSRLVEAAPGRSEAEAALQKQVAALEGEVLTRWVEVQKRSKEFEVASQAMSERGRAAQQEGVLKTEAELGAFWKTASEQIQALSEAASKELTRTVEEAVARFAESEGYDLVFDRSSGRLLYAAKAYGQTEGVLPFLLGQRTNVPPAAESVPSGVTSQP